MCATYKQYFLYSRKYIENTYDRMRNKFIMIVYTNVGEFRSNYSQSLCTE